MSNIGTGLILILSIWGVAIMGIRYNQFVYPVALFLTIVMVLLVIYLLNIMTIAELDYKILHI